MSTALRTALTLALATTPLSCRKDGKIDIKDPTVVKGDAGQVPASALAPVNTAAELLPQATQMYFEAKSAARVFEVAQRERWMSAFPKEYGKATQELVEEFGVDLLDPATWADVGLDVNGPVGLCLLSIAAEAGCGFATVSDAGKLRQFLVEMAGRRGKELRPTSLGGAEILRTSSAEVTFVIRPPIAMVVIVDREENAPDFAQEIAVADPLRSLSADSGFRRSTGGYKGSDVVGFMNVASIGNDAVTRMEQLDREFGDKSGPSKRNLAQREVLRFVTGGMSAIGVRGDAKRNSVVVEAKVTMPEDAFPRSLIQNTEGQPPLTWALDGRMLMMLSGTLDVDRTVQFIDMLAKAEGGSWKELVAEVKREVGIDLNADVTPLFTGAAGGAVAIDKEPTFKKSRDIVKSFGFGVYADVNDPKKTQAVLDAVAKKAKLAGVKVSKDARTGTQSFDVPEFRPIHVGVHGKHLVVSTDAGLGPRLDKGKAGSVAKKTTPAGAYAAVSRKGSAAAYATDYSPFMWLFFGVGFDTAISPRAAAGVPESREGS